MVSGQQEARMRLNRSGRWIPILLVIGLIGLRGHAQAPAGAQPQTPAKIYNTAKQKVMAGKQIIGGTIYSPDPNIYCAMASAGFDFLWIEMQHSPLTYSDVAKMIWACRNTPATPMILVPDATEGDIHKATDIGALGISVPPLDTVETAKAAVRSSRRQRRGGRTTGA